MAEYISVGDLGKLGRLGQVRWVDKVSDTVVYDIEDRVNDALKRGVIVLEEVDVATEALAKQNLGEPLAEEERDLLLKLLQKKLPIWKVLAAGLGAAGLVGLVMWKAATSK